MKKQILLFVLTAFVCSYAVAGNEKWYKGNTHCHTVVSDGKNLPAEVVAAYHNHGYNFLVITDHNFLLQTDTIKKPANLRKDFLLVPGEEVTDRISVHTTAFNISSYVPFDNDPNRETDLVKRREEIKRALDHPLILTPTELIQLHVDGILKAGGIPFLNHPNFSQGVKISDILPVKNLHHLEIYNGHPTVFNWGKEGLISVEAKWDSLLSRGVVMYGVASDDEHKLVTNDPEVAGPFRGWLMVQSKELTPKALQQSIATGKFYASNSVILKTCEMSTKKYIIEIDRDATKKEIAESCGVPRIDLDGQEGFLIEFIGNHGKVLSSSKELKASYKPKKEDQYVRCRVTHCTKTDKGYEKRFAWTQPVFLN